MPTRRLTSEQQVFIVQRLAFYETPAEIIAAVAEMWPDLKLDSYNVSKYNPETVHGQSVSAKLTALFHETRERFKAGLIDIPIAQQSFRLRELLSLYRAARKNVLLKVAILEQAAKECGGAFTSRREISGPRGGPVEIESREFVIVDPADLSTEELRRIAARDAGEPDPNPEAEPRLVFRTLPGAVEEGEVEL